jgi:hypothetical protein
MEERQDSAPSGGTKPNTLTNQLLGCWVSHSFNPTYRWLGRKANVMQAPDEIDCQDVMPGFNLDLTKIL